VNAGNAPAIAFRAGLGGRWRLPRWSWSWLEDDLVTDPLQPPPESSRCLFGIPAVEYVCAWFPVPAGVTDDIAGQQKNGMRNGDGGFLHSRVRGDSMQEGS
jgi:hypothetical protein